MKFKFLVASMAAFAAVGAQAAVTTAVIGGYHYPEHQSVSPEENHQIISNDGHVYGVAIGYEFGNKATQVQVEYLINDSKDKVAAPGLYTGERAKTREKHHNLNVVHEYKGGGGSTSPYVLVGVGHNLVTTTIDGQSIQTDDTIANVGIGAKRYIGKNVALRGELRGVHHFEANKWDGKALIGAELKFGGSGSVPSVPAANEPIIPINTQANLKPKAEFLAVIPVMDDQYMDQDGDGVPDHLDICHETPRNLVVDERGCPQTIKVAEDLRMELRVFFDKDKSILKPQFGQEVAKVAEQMKKFPNATAMIEGHASKDSNKSSATYNQRLSQARAEAVKSMLINEFGIAVNRLTAVGYGFDKPLTSNATEEGRSINRRVYAVIQGERVESVQKTKDMR